MRTVTHPEHQNDYADGYDVMLFTIQTLGWEEARKQYNEAFPLGHKPDSLARYYYAAGGIDALLDTKK